MNPELEQRLARHFAASHGVISRRQAMALGMPGPLIDYQLRTQRWAAVYRGVYQRRGEHLAQEGRLLAACLSLTTGAVASHMSAAWLWELVPGRLSRLVVSTSRAAAVRAQFEVRRPSDLDSTDRTHRRGIPVTTPARTLCDLGDDEGPAAVQSAIDAALARGLVTVGQLTEAIDRSAAPGRRGPAVLRASLGERGVVGVPDPSVLESRVARLLKGWGVTPQGTEVVVAGGAYRVDFLLAPGLVLEADGFVFHSSPAAKAADDHRRNRLQLEGFIVLHTNWVEVTNQPDRLRATVFAGLERIGRPVGGQRGR